MRFGQFKYAALAVSLYEAARQSSQRPLIRRRGDSESFAWFQALRQQLAAPERCSSFSVSWAVPSRAALMPGSQHYLKAITRGRYGDCRACNHFGRYDVNPNTNMRHHEAPKGCKWFQTGI